MNPEGPAHIEEGEAGLEVTAHPHAVMHVGSAGREEKHSLLNPTAPGTFPLPLPSSCYEREGGMEHNSCISPKGYVRVQESGWKTSSPSQWRAQHGARWRLLAGCLVDTAAFSSFFQANSWRKENCSGSHSCAALLCALQEVIAQLFISAQWYNGIGSL